MTNGGKASGDIGMWSPSNDDDIHWTSDSSHYRMDGRVVPKALRELVPGSRQKFVATALTIN